MTETDSRPNKVLMRLRDVAVTTLYPIPCRVCGSVVESWRDGMVCDRCWRIFDRQYLPESYCVKCGLILPQTPSPAQNNEQRCGRCNNLAFTFARACGPYEGALRECVLWLKTRPQIPPRLRQLLQATFYLLDELQPCHSIIPVPLHTVRLEERTFNQSEIIARTLSSLTGLRTNTGGVIRAKNTERHRAGMGALERAGSLHNAFRIRAPRLIENRSLLVVDDVMTTASTAHEISQTLIEGGARSVSVLTIARATGTN